MLEELFISFRESLEAVVLLGFLLAFLDSKGLKKSKKYVYLGAVSAVLVSSAIAIYFSSSYSHFLEEIEESFSGWVLIFSSLLIFSVLKFMKNPEKSMGEHIKRFGEPDFSYRFTPFLLSFILVFREAVEVAVFLTPSSFSSEVSSSFVLLGALLALLIGALAGKFVSSRHIGAFFKHSATVLFLFAIFLLVSGVIELISEHPSFS